MTGLNLMMAAALSAGVNGPDAPTGASLAWTSQDPIVAQARELVLIGRLADAEKLLEKNAAGADTEAARARREMVEIIRRIRGEYPFDQQGLLAKLQKSIPDATSEDLDRWREAKDVRFRVLDGQIRYFNREPSFLLRFNDEAKKRAEARSPGSTPTTADAKLKNKLIEHLEQVVAAAERSGHPEVLPVKHRVKVALTVEPHRPGAKAGSLVRCWLPFPQEYRQQKDVKLIHTSPAEHVLAPNAMEGSGKVTGALQRTVYLERKIDDPSKPVVFEEKFEYVSYAYYPRLSESEARELPPDFDRTYLAERPPHIVFTPEIRAAVEQAVEAEKNPLGKLRKIYRYLDGKLRWGPEVEYSILPNFSMNILTSTRGDCGEQSVLLMTMCRLAGVPARWQSGFETKPWAWNMHDWAEVYIAPWGWLSVDMSYHLQPSADPRINEFYIGHQDSYRLIVNLDYGRELAPPKADLRSEPADFQRGEVEIDGRNLYYDEWDYDIQFEWEPLDR